MVGARPLVLLTKPIIYELLEEIDNNPVVLTDLKGLSEEDFLGSPHNYLLAERCFQSSDPLKALQHLARFAPRLRDGS